jgi:cytoplasmic iron level regulating protein YaaA (DUF328/UPF0246 family)
MLTVISPANTWDFKTKPAIAQFTIPDMLSPSEKLAGKLQKLSPEEISELMGIPASLADLNFERSGLWRLPFMPKKPGD